MPTDLADNKIITRVSGAPNARQLANTGDGLTSGRLALLVLAGGGAGVLVTLGAARIRRKVVGKAE